MSGGVVAVAPDQRSTAENESALARGKDKAPFTNRTDACASGIAQQNRPNADLLACGVTTSSACSHAPKGAAARCCFVVALGRALLERLWFVAPFSSWETACSSTIG